MRTVAGFMTTMPYNKYSVLSHFMRFSETKMRASCANMRHSENVSLLTLKNIFSACVSAMSLSLYMHDVLHQYVMSRIDIETLLQIHTHKHMRYFSLEFTPRLLSICIHMYMGAAVVASYYLARVVLFITGYIFRLSFTRKKRTRRRCAVLSANCEHITFRQSHGTRTQWGWCGGGGIWFLFLLLSRVEFFNIINRFHI